MMSTATGLPKVRQTDQLRFPATLTRLSLHLTGVLPTVRLPVLRRHTRTFPRRYKSSTTSSQEFPSTTGVDMTWTSDSIFVLSLFILSATRSETLPNAAIPGVQLP